MFLDASAIVAMIAGEPEAAALAARLQADKRRMTSPLALWEAAAALSRIAALPPSHVREELRAFAGLAGVQVLAVPPQAADLAVDAYDRFGAGRHRAGLAVGECFSHACARYYRQPLLYSGGGFALTDIEPA